MDPTALLNPTDAAPNTPATAADAKLASFDLVPGESARVEFVSASLTDMNMQYDGLAGSTLLDLFSAGENEIAGDRSDACHGPLLDAAPAEAGYDATAMVFGQGHQFYGFNGEDATAGIRWGFASNDEADGPFGPQVGIGWRSTGGATGGVRFAVQTDCNPGNCGCYGAGTTVADAAANLWVR